MILTHEELGEILGVIDEARTATAISEDSRKIEVRDLRKQIVDLEERNKALEKENTLLSLYGREVNMWRFLLTTGRSSSVSTYPDAFLVSR